MPLYNLEGIDYYFDCLHDSRQQLRDTSVRAFELRMEAAALRRSSEDLLAQSRRLMAAPLPRDPFGSAPAGNDD